MRNKIYFSLLLLAPLSLTAADTLPSRSIETLLEKIYETQKQLSKDIFELKRQLSPSELQKLAPKPPENGSEECEALYKEGASAFEAQEYSKAKEAFQRLFERAPSNAAANFNLALTYYQMDNDPLARRMFQASLELNKDLPESGAIKKFLNMESKEKEKKSEKESALNNTLTNLTKEISSRIKSPSLSLPERMKESTKLLLEMQAQIKDADLYKEHFPFLLDKLIDLQLYAKANQACQDYESALKGELLYDTYYTKKLLIEEKEKELSLFLKQCTPTNHPEAKKLKKDLHELNVFASQLHDFVKTSDPQDPDLAKICERLKEYRWGGKAGRQVILASRYQEIVYSSLSGTLPLDRYQDVKGEKFFQKILLLADHLSLKENGIYDITLTIGHKMVPYHILFTYIPKLELFILVKLPAATTSTETR
ncbi:MAG: hypothetical protein K0S07_327 [Chlamydiales bacterium]|jgi:tetratricopeptide (TPR) repeat protein|nr:hypothetical protein [Chlamydiales bacterium]